VEELEDDYLTLKNWIRWTWVMRKSLVWL
jgi:hypothetical protein